jgi:hypothetical protein
MHSPTDARRFRSVNAAGAIACAYSRSLWHPFAPVYRSRLGDCTGVCVCAYVGRPEPAFWRRRRPPPAATKTRRALRRPQRRVHARRGHRCCQLRINDTHTHTRTHKHTPLPPPPEAAARPATEHFSIVAALLRTCMLGERSSPSEATPPPPPHPPRRCSGAPPQAAASCCEERSPAPIGGRI